MSLRHRLRTLLRRRDVEAEMAEEMRFHLEQRAADLADDGLPDTEARLAAQRRFGNVASLQEQSRDTFGWGSFERLLNDLRFALRQLVKSPGFSLLAIVTLGLGIGANTSMFSVLNGVMLKPLPFADPDRIDRFYRSTPQDREGHFSVADFLDLRRAQEGYGQVAAYTAASASLSEPGQPAEFVYLAECTVDFLPMLGATPQLGRVFRAGEDTPGRNRLAILSQRTWQNRFGARRDIIGRTVRIDGTPHEIVGVLPVTLNDWRYLGDVDIYRPLALTAEQTADRHKTLLRILGRRAPGLARADAAGFIANLGQRLAKEFPGVNAEAAWRTVSLPEVAAGAGGKTVLPMLIGLSGFVLLIACSNLANLLLARTMARAREFAVRAALGASRVQLLRPLVAESLLLALGGAALALVVALWFRDWAAVRSAGDNGDKVNFVLDARVGAWAFGASLVTAVAFGVAPALFALRLDLNATLKTGGRGSTGGRGHQRFRQFLIVAQFALAMVLLAGAGLFIRGLHELNHRRAGWESTWLVTGNVLLPSGKYAGADQIAAFHRLALERLAALPGTASASISSFTPFFNWPDIRKFHVDGRDRPEPGREPAAVVNAVSPRYFDTVGTPLLAGRAFTAADNTDATRVLIVSQSTARGLFGEENPLGRRVVQVEGDNRRVVEIVGVVADVKPAVEDPHPVTFQFYLPLAQESRRQCEIAVRTNRVAPAPFADAIRRTMAELDPDLPVRRLQHADARIDRANYQLAVLRDILAAIALLGLGLASLGIYGVIARTMAQRTGEFAIRLALGASVQNLTRLVLASGVKLALVGSALGLFGAFGVARIIAAAFPGIHTNNLPVLTGTTLLLVAIALLACWLPARRAGKVDAMTALRAE